MELLLRAHVQRKYAGESLSYGFSAEAKAELQDIKVVGRFLVERTSGEHTEVEGTLGVEVEGVIKEILEVVKLEEYTETTILDTKN